MAFSEMVVRQDASQLYQGDTIEIAINLRDPTGEKSFSHGGNSTYTVKLPGTVSPVELTSGEGEVVRRSLGSSILDVTISPAKSAGLREGKPTIQVEVDDEGSIKTFTENADFSIVKRPL